MAQSALSDTERVVFLNILKTHEIAAVETFLAGRFQVPSATGE